MRHTSGLTLTLLALAAVVPARAADKKDAKETPAVSAKDVQALAGENGVVGTLLRAGGSEQQFTLRIEYPTLQPKSGAGSPAHRQQAAILKGKNSLQQALQMQRLVAQLEREQLRHYKVTTEHKDFDLQASADAAVRYQTLPVEYDEKGQAKKHTAEELKALKGPDPKLPGYAADFDKLKAGAVVRVTFKKPDAKDKKADKEKDDDKTPQVALIVILKDAPADAATPADKGKKK